MALVGGRVRMWDRQAEPTRPVAPVRIRWTIAGECGGGGESKGTGVEQLQARCMACNVDGQTQRRAATSLSRSP